MQLLRRACGRWCISPAPPSSFVLEQRHKRAPDQYLFNSCRLPLAKPINSRLTHNRLNDRYALIVTFPGYPMYIGSYTGPVKCWDSKSLKVPCPVWN